MARPVHLLDISHHNAISDWNSVPKLPVVHKVCEGGKADKRFATRMPTIRDRTQRFGGYVVLWPNRPGKISIADQMAAYAELMAPFWRQGAFTQLDCEPWEYLTVRDRVNAAEIVEAHRLHVDAFGRPPTVYLNPRQMPGVIEEVRESIPDVAFWEPHYGRDGPDSARRNRATLHQWTSSHTCSGFTAGIDANEILQPDELDRVCGLTTAPTEQPSSSRTETPSGPTEAPGDRTATPSGPTEAPGDRTETPSGPTEAPSGPALVGATLWRHAKYADLFLIGTGSIIRVSEDLRDNLKARGVPIVGDDDDDTMLETVLRSANMTKDDLTPR